MLMSNFLLEKSSKNSKFKDHQLALERRLELWHKGKFEELYFGGETIQVSLKTIQNTSSIAEILKKFKKYMMKGNINSALNLLTNNMENGVSNKQGYTFCAVCAGQETSIKAAIHSMNMMYEDDNTVVFLLVDASNTFNWLNI